jgi:hypothetical protein
MPSPIGHALGGVLAGWLGAPILAARKEDTSKDTSAPTRNVSAPAAAPNRIVAWLERGSGHEWRSMGLFALLGVAPDFDFLLGRHSHETHGVGAVGLVVVVVWLLTGGRWRWALAAGLAYGSHIVLDWLGSDTAPPIGVMALWPFSHSFYQSDLHWFMAIWREPERTGFVRHNLLAICREVMLLGPPVAAVWWWRARRRAVRMRRPR